MPYSACFSLSAYALLVLFTAAPICAEDVLSYPDLVHRLVDMEHLAVLPRDGERCAQWSSYERASHYDATARKYRFWEANRDGDGFIRNEGPVMVLAEMEGPGCLWRVWSALPEKGRVKIYLDGAEEPAVDMPFEDYFTGKAAPFDFPALSYGLEDKGCRGKNLYFPIPYQESCKIVAEKGWGKYFHFTYGTFPEGTRVPTFTGKLSTADRQALCEVDQYFQNSLGQHPSSRPLQWNAGDRSPEHVPAGGRRVVATLDGPNAVTAIRARVELGDREDQMAALRDVVLAVTWDGDAAPAVWCPLGDFFGTAPGVNHYRSLATGMTEDGWYSYWYMPFGEQAKIELINDGATPRNVQLEVATAPLTRPITELGRFHCKWHRDVFPVSEDRRPDWTLLKTAGRGRFCGAMLHAWVPKGGTYPPVAPGHAWWGEGDEKFFVDGEHFPSTFGTGTEDYFGYAWGHGGLFQMPYHGQTMTQNNHGHQSVFRWQVPDAVPFTQSFEGYLEKYFPNDLPARYATTVCWYLSAEGEDPHKPAPAEQRSGYYQSE